MHQLTHNMRTDCLLNYNEIPSSDLGRTCCVQKFFLTFRTIFVHNMFYPCSAKRRASDKDLPVFFSIFIDGPRKALIWRAYKKQFFRRLHCQIKPQEHFSSTSWPILLLMLSWASEFTFFFHELLVKWS